ncbi:amidase signature enzyme [Tricholoma matsutake]|nr:amidase signature enzyme [Tricholoma matsutake 945]
MEGLPFPDPLALDGSIVMEYINIKSMTVKNLEKFCHMFGLTPSFRQKDGYLESLRIFSADEEAWKALRHGINMHHHKGPRSSGARKPKLSSIRREALFSSAQGSIGSGTTGSTTSGVDISGEKLSAWALALPMVPSLPVVPSDPSVISTNGTLHRYHSMMDDGRQLHSSLTPSEKLNKASASILELLSLPHFIKKILSFFSHMSDPLLADLFDIMQPKSMVEVCKLVTQKEQYMAAWHKQWIRSGLDFVLTVLYALPAFKHGEEEKATLMSAGYTCIFSMLDYTTGILPVDFMDKEIDHLPSIQVVGRRLEEEKVLEGMKVIEASLKSQGMVFVGKAKV